MECLTDSQTQTNKKQHENDETWILLFLILVSHKHTTEQSKFFFGEKMKNGGFLKFHCCYGLNEIVRVC